MNTHADKTQENKSQAAIVRLPKLQNNCNSTFRFEDNRPEAIAQRKLQEAIDNSPRVKQLRVYQDMANKSPQVNLLRIYQAMADNYTPKTAQRKGNPGEEILQRIQKRENKTGLPDNLKSGIENLSGYSMDDVKVHYNSGKPSQLQAHAYVQGPDIHIASGQEKHLPHEAWHVVQQKQGRVVATSFNRGAGVNDQPDLEHEADVMGQKANGHQSQTAVSVPLLMISPSASPLQLIVVDDSDLGKTYEIRPWGASSNAQGVLKAISGGGWYTFDVGGTMVKVRGQENIIREITAPSTANPLAAILSHYNVHALSTTVSEFTVNDIARTYNVSPQQALQMIADSFGRDPRTIRIHYPFGSKTISRGNEAFSNPGETDKLPQAMVSYRMGDYPKHKKVGTDYDDWADELSDSDEPESERADLARRMTQYLTQSSPSENFPDLSGSQMAALGGIFTATQISDRLRTYQDSEVTPMDFSAKIEERSKGLTTMHDIFGDKSSSSFLPARKGGSGQQRSQLSTYQGELLATALLWQNNCLINAICQAAYGRNATMEELVVIRSNLGNVGQMLAATQNTINVIRQALYIPNPITVRYALGSGGMNEVLPGAGVLINIYHTGIDHFQHTLPLGAPYDMT